MAIALALGLFERVLLLLLGIVLEEFFEDLWPFSDTDSRVASLVRCVNRVLLN